MGYEFSLRWSQGLEFRGCIDTSAGKMERCACPVMWPLFSVMLGSG